MRKYLLVLLIITGFAMSACSSQPEGGAAEAVKSAASEAAAAVKTEIKTAAKKLAQKVEKKGAEAAATAVNDDILIFQADNSDGKITPETIQEAFEKSGFYIAANNNMNIPYKRDFNNTYYDVYNLAAYYNKDIVAQFIKEYPKIGLFAPISMSIYTKKGDKTISIATLSVKRMAEISGIPADHKGWKALDELIKKALKAALPNGKFIQANNRKIDVKAPLVVEASMKMGEEWEDKLEDLENDFESALSPNGFSMPAFNELSDEIDDTGYDFYITYSICKIPVIYAISKEHPEAGAYAPCSMYMYKKEGDDTVHFGFPSVYNWISSMGIEDEASKKILIDAEEKFKNILKELTSK